MLPKAPQQKKKSAPQYMQWFLILGPDLLALIKSLGEVVVFVLHFSVRTEALQSRRIYDFFFFFGGSENKLQLIKTLFLDEGDGACMMRTITDAHIAPTGQKIEFIY